MEDYIHKSDYTRDEEIKALFDRIEKLDGEEFGANCCFCETKMGALIRLHQGWCCAKCFKEVVLKPEVENTKPLDVKQEGGNGSPPTFKNVGIRA